MKIYWFIPFQQKKKLQWIYTTKADKIIKLKDFLFLYIFVESWPEKYKNSITESVGGFILTVEWIEYIHFCWLDNAVKKYKTTKIEWNGKFIIKYGSIGGNFYLRKFIVTYKRFSDYIIYIWRKWMGFMFKSPI